MTLAVVLIAALAAVGAWLRSDADAPEWPDSSPVQGTPPTSYAILYRTVHPASEPVVERLVVDRPFRSRFESGTTVRVTDAGWFATTTDGENWTRVEVPVTIAGSDLRPLTLLDAGLEAGLIEEVGADEIVSRPCRRYRFGAPLTSAFTPVGHPGREDVEVCIDGDGLVLAERWTIDGKAVREREAVHVAVGPVEDAEFVVPGNVAEVGVDSHGGAVEPMEGDQAPGFAEDWTVDAPAGFDPAGRWAVVPPALGRAPALDGPGPVEVAMVTDAWTRGGDLLVLDQGATVNGLAPPWDDLPYGESVDLGGDLGAAQLVWDTRMSELRLHRPDGGFVRVAGTLPPRDLLAVARTLVDRSDTHPAEALIGADADDTED